MRTSTAARRLSKEIQLDGLSMTIAEVGGDPRVLTLPPDALQELSIATGSYSAEFGNSGGGVERFTIRSGTNNFHGNLYEFLRNDVLDARDFFQASRSVHRENEYGGSIGGPIIKNKTFFFFNLNYFKFRSGPSNQIGSVPTPAFKNGDMSALRNPDGSLIQLYDPATTRSDGAGGFTATHSPETSFRLVASAQSPGRSSLSFQIPRPLGSSITILPVKTAGTIIGTSHSRSTIS